MAKSTVRAPRSTTLVQIPTLVQSTKLVQSTPLAAAAAAAVQQNEAPAAVQQNAALQQIAAQTAAASVAADASVAAATAPSAGTQTRLAVQAAGPAAGFAAIGVNGRKWPALGPVTQQIWQAALQWQLASKTQSLPSAGKNSLYTAALQAAGVKPTSISCGLTQYKAYTGQGKGAAALTLEQLKALAQANA